MSRKVAFITAAGKGNALGFAIAQAFAAAGYNLVITARNKGRVKEAALELQEQYGVEVLPVALSVDRDGGERAVDGAVERVAERFGRLDVLVNASQAAKAGDPLQRFKMADIALALDSGITAVFLLMKSCYPMLKESRGTVINLTSAGAAAGLEGFSMIAASKEGIRGMSRVAACEWGQDGIDVHCVDPRVQVAGAEEIEGLSTPDDLARECVSLCG